jgi:hypothetical protein
LYERPVNSIFYHCDTCDSEYTPDYLLGYWNGQRHATPVAAIPNVYTIVQSELSGVRISAGGNKWLYYDEDNSHWVVCDGNKRGDHEVYRSADETEACRFYMNLIGFALPEVEAK